MLTSSLLQNPAARTELIFTTRFRYSSGTVAARTSIETCPRIASVAASDASKTRREISEGNRR